MSGTAKQIIRIVLSPLCAIVFIVGYAMLAALIASIFPGNFFTQNVDTNTSSAPGLIYAPVAGLVTLLFMLGMTGGYSTAGYIYRVVIMIVPPLVFYAVLAYLLLGRLRWFRRKQYTGEFAEPPPPPEKW